MDPSQNFGPGPTAGTKPQPTGPNYSFGANPLGQGWRNRDIAEGSAQTTGKVIDDTAYGGYRSTVVRGPNGELLNDTNAGGRQADVSRFQNMAQAAQARQAYQNNFGGADVYLRAAEQSRGGELDALGMMRNRALGLGQTPAEQLQRQAMMQGMNEQQSAALSARGGSLAQAAALRSAQANQGATMQQGNAQIQALRADDMARAREAYMQGAGQVRAGDYQAMGLGQERMAMDQQAALAQRQLNQQAALWGEGQAYDINRASQQAALEKMGQQQGVFEHQLQIDRQEADRTQRLVGAGASAAGSGLGALGSVKWGGGSPDSGMMSDDERAQFDQDVNSSDERLKTNIRPVRIASAAMARVKGAR